MAKISSYPSDANVTTSDRLIGSDNENSNETKNFQVGDIINLASSIITPQILSTVASAYVPYIGALGQVDLGTYDIYAGSANLLYINTTYGITTNGSISLGGNEGNTGDVLLSQGPGTVPVWSNAILNAVPYTGANQNVDLGSYALLADSVTVWNTLNINGEIKTNGNPGNVGDVLVSQGAGTNPIWVAGASQPYLYAIDTTTQSHAINTIAPIQYNSVQDSNGISILVDDTYGTPNVIAFDKAGVYNIQFSAQLQRSSGGSSQQVSIWLRQNEVDIANSNTHLNVQANAGYLVASWNFFVSVGDGEGVQIMWTQTDAINIQYVAADLVIPHPATPSVILTVNKIA